MLTNTVIMCHKLSEVVRFVGNSDSRSRLEMEEAKLHGTGTNELLADWWEVRGNGGPCRILLSLVPPIISPRVLDR